MNSRETNPTYDVVDIEEYEENMSDRVSVEDMQGSGEVFVFYGRIRKVSRAAIRAYASVNIETFEDNGIRASGSVTFRDIDFSPAISGYEFPGIFHARFFIPDSVTPILVKPGIVGKRPIEMGFLVRDDDGYDQELLADMALPSLGRDPELIAS
jgi:hypothetical protein